LETPRAERYILNISHPDYADVSVISRTPLTGQRWSLVRVQSETVDPKNPVSITDKRPGLGGATLKLPADALVDSAGHAPAGPVRATIATLDVSNGEGPGDWAARTDDGQEAFLVSY